MIVICQPDEKLKQYATDVQWRHYVALCKHGSARKAAAATGTARSSILEAVSLLRRKAVQHGYAPPDWTKPIPENQVLRGMSTNYDNPAEGIKEQWVKTKEGPMDPDAVVTLPDPKRIAKVATNYTPGGVQQQWVTEIADAAEREKLWTAFAEELGKSIPRAPVIAKIDAAAQSAARLWNPLDLLAVLPIGDHHHGMLAWDKETGSDSYDGKISENLLHGAVEHLVFNGPDCCSGLLVFLGDFFHYDSLVAETPQNRNHLDSEGRYGKMMSTGARMIRHAIDTASQKYDDLTVIFESGNHDPSTMQAIAIWVACLYENNPRIHVNTSPRVHHYYKFGSVLIGTHHGDKTKMDQLPMVMAADVPEMWGDTKFRYWLTGHVHQQIVKEFPGASTESFNILAPVDAWAAGQGYRNRRNMKQIIMHLKYGEVERRVVNPLMLSQESDK